MLESLIDRITRASLRYKWITIAISILLLAGGAFAVTQLNQELLPKIEFPQSVLLATNQGMELDEMMDQVTIPIEEAIAPIEGVVNYESTTSNGFSVVVILSEFGVDLEAVRDEINAAVGEIDFPEGMETPELLTFSFSDLPVAALSVSSSELTLPELKELVEAEIVPQLEGVENVGGVQVSGGQELPADVPSDEPPPAPTEAPQPTAVPTIEPTEEPAQTGEEGIPLPDSWIQAAAAQNVTLETTADLTGEMFSVIGNFAPQLLEELTPEMLLATPGEALAEIPETYLETLEPDLLAQIEERIAQAPTTGTDGELPAPWIAAGDTLGMPITQPEDITPEIVQGVAGFAPQMLNLLSPDQLRRLSPESLAWLPVAFVESLDPALQDELDELAQPAGGVGFLAAQAEEQAAAQAADAPQLSGGWLQPAEGATEPVFQTAADLMNSGFASTASELLNLLVQRGLPEDAILMGDLTPEVISWLDDNEEGFLENLSPSALRLLSPEVLSGLPEDFLETLDPGLRTELAAIAAGTATAFIPTETINRLDGIPSLSMTVFKDSEANTVSVSHAVFDKLEELEAGNSGLRFEVAFEQATFIEESISGVAREGGLGAIFAVLVILIFLSGTIGGKYKLSWRSTLVTAVSIPLSVFMAFALFQWLPPLANLIIQPLVDATTDIPVLGSITTVVQRLFPVGITLNIMTLSGMTVAIGRVVDDSIVVLENIYRHIQRGDEMRQSVLKGTRDVAIAIFASTVTTVVVFLPIGLLGGLIGEFFLPFGISVTYALASSFLVAVTIVPLLAFLFIRKDQLPEERETALQRGYTPILRWALSHRGWTLAIAGALFLGSMALMAQRPRAFIPDLGEPQISVNVNLPDGTMMSETDEVVAQFEGGLTDVEGLGVILTEIGSAGGLESVFFGSGIDQGAASLQIGVEVTDDELDALTAEIRALAESTFGEENVIVTSGTLSGGAFGGFSLVLSGDPQALAAFDEQAIIALDAVEGLTNVSSNLTDTEAILRVDGEPALSYTGELETEDSLGVTELAKAAMLEVVPEGITVSEGFETEQQTQGFAQAISGVLISIVVVYLAMVITFRSFVHPFTILFSLPLAVIGAALALWITDRVIGISVLVGMMMLVGIVVTNAIVLLSRVQTNRKVRGMNAHEALIEGGRTRLRPILMTAIAAMLALVPLALGFTEGAIIAAELATVVIGGLFTSTMLTLLVVPVMYSLLDRIGHRPEPVRVSSSED